MTKDLLVGIFILLLGSLFFLLLIPLGIDQPSNIKQITLAPDFWPKIITIIIAIMGIFLIIEAKKNPHHDKPENWRSRVTGLSVVFVALFSFYILIPYFGMVLNAMLLIAGLMLFAKERRYFLILLISIAMPSLLYIFFVFIANIPIPLGIFEGLRG